MKTSGKIIITGGKGFVGKYLHDELRLHWKEATIITWDLPEIDVTKPETYADQLRKLRPSWVIHLAAIASVPVALKDPRLVHAVNVDATKDLLKSVAEHSPATKVFVTSSADIYGSTLLTTGGKSIKEMALHEAHPSNPYAQSKWEMEKIIEESFIDRCLRVRPFPHIGPGQKIGFVVADFASQIAAVEKGKQKPVIRVGNLEAYRDFTDVRDVVRAYQLLMERGQLGQVYHVASGVAVKIKDILDELITISTCTITVEQDPQRVRPSDSPVVVGDASKLKALTGWEPKIPLHQSLQDILDYWRSIA